MPRYFFHFRQGSETVPDESGVVFPTFEDAYLAAFEGARDMWLELLRERRDPRQCAFDVRDEEGRLVFTLPFSEVLDSCRQEVRPESRMRTPVFHSAMENSKRAHRNFSELRAEMRKARQALKEARALMAEADDLFASHGISPDKT